MSKPFVCDILFRFSDLNCVAMLLVLLTALMLHRSWRKNLSSWFVLAFAEISVVEKVRVVVENYVMEISIFSQLAKDTDGDLEEEKKLALSSKKIP